MLDAVSTVVTGTVELSVTEIEEYYEIKIGGGGSLIIGLRKMRRSMAKSMRVREVKPKVIFIITYLFLFMLCNF